MLIHTNDDRLRLVVGRSGSGKDYLLNSLGLTKIASYTTRPIRKGETNGIGHIFVGDEEYLNTSKEDMAAYTFYNGYHYWVTFEMLEHTFAYVIDPAGVEFLDRNRDKMHRGFVTILVVASVWKRIRNMRRRGDTFVQIVKRLINDRKAFRHFEKHGKYDVVIRM